MSAPTVETQSTQPQTEVPEGATVQIVSRDEKKARKAIKEAGCKKVAGVSRVVLRKRSGSSFVVENPEVYRTPNGSYIVFGPAQIQEQDIAKQLASLAGQQDPAAGGDAADKSPEAINADLEAAVNSAKITEEEDPADDEGPTESKWDTDQINMIMEQASVSRGKAIKALDENGGDLVNALMALTM